MVVLHIIWTILLLAVFALIVVWAWSRQRRESFHEAAHIPLKDEEYRDG